MSTWDEDAGYDYGDAKHPTYGERLLDHVDYLRKVDRENPPLVDRDPGDESEEAA